MSTLLFSLHSFIYFVYRVYFTASSPSLYLAPLPNSRPSWKCDVVSCLVDAEWSSARIVKLSTGSLSQLLPYRLAVTFTELSTPRYWFCTTLTLQLTPSVCILSTHAISPSYLSLRDPRSVAVHITVNRVPAVSSTRHPCSSSLSTSALCTVDFYTCCFFISLFLFSVWFSIYLFIYYEVWLFQSACHFFFPKLALQYHRVTYIFFIYLCTYFFLLPGMD